MRFRSADRSRVAQIERDLLVVNQLPPYPTFAKWSPSVLAAAKVFAELVEASGVSRLGLRYINRIDFDRSRIDLDDWFTVTPKLPSSWQDTAGSFFVRAERKVSPSLRLILTFGSAPANPGESKLMLDLYAAHSLSSPVPVDRTETLIVEAHSCIEDAFEGSITDKLRSRFRAAPAS